MGDAPRIVARTGWRQCLWLTLGLWAFTYLTFLMPSLADGDGIAWVGYPIIAAAVLPGLALSLPLALLLWATRGWRTVPRAVLVGGVAAMAAWCHSMLDASIVLALRALLLPGTAQPVTLERLVDKFLSYLWIYELYATTVGLILSAALAHERERRAGAVALAARQAELSVLRHQVNPHFLFNTLNAVSALIVTGRAARADDMVGQLSRYLRASLDGGADEPVALERELALLATYLEIEQARFGDRLRFAVACPPDLADALVPAFVLQPLVENAVKHAVGGSSCVVAVRVRASADAGLLRLTVSDDGMGGAASGGGAGLDALRARLGILYGGAAGVEAGRTPAGYRATVALPLVRAAGDRGHGGLKHARADR